MTKLQRLLDKYKEANRARIAAYKRRSATLGGRWDNKAGKRVFPVPITEELKKKLDADIEVARLRKLEVSAELRAYCKKKKLAIKWGDSNQVDGVYNEVSHKLRKSPYNHSSNSFLTMLFNLKLSTQLRYFW